MSKIDCEVIKDLLPLYADNACSEQTKKLVEEHISDCEDCFEQLKRMQAPIDENKITEKEITAKKAFKSVKKRWIASILIVVFLIPIIYLTVNQISGSGISFSAIKTMVSAQGLIDDIKSLNADGVYQKTEEQNRRLYEDVLTNPDYWNTLIVENGVVRSGDGDEALKIDQIEYIAITIDDFKYFVSESDTEIQKFYEEYKADKDSTSFWFKVLNSGKALIPEKALNEIKDNGYTVDEDKLSKLIKIVYNGTVYYVKNTIGVDEEDYISNSLPTIFKVSEIIPDNVRSVYASDMEDLNSAYTDMQKHYKDMGVDNFLQKRKEDISDRYNKMKERGITIKSVDFAEATSDGVIYKVTFVSNDKEITNGKLIVSYKDGYLSAHEMYTEGQINNFYNKSNTAVTIIGGPISWDREITVETKN